MFIDVIDVQPENADAPILVILSGILIVVISFPLASKNFVTPAYSLSFIALLPSKSRTFENFTFVPANGAPYILIWALFLFVMFPK